MDVLKLEGIEGRANAGVSWGVAETALALTSITIQAENE